MELLSGSFYGHDDPLPVRNQELINLLASGRGYRVEKISSLDATSPEGFWYDQEWDEFVILLDGNSEVEFADGRVVSLERGGWLCIPRRCRHRIRSTAADRVTYWLAIHFDFRETGDETCK